MYSTRGPLVAELACRVCCNVCSCSCIIAGMMALFAILGVIGAAGLVAAGFIYMRRSGGGDRGEAMHDDLLDKGNEI